MSPLVDKLMHFVVGLAVGAGFWWVLERYTPEGVRRINPIWFVVMLIWGASGLFFFRKLGIPILSDQIFYMAIPDWDIPLYNWTRLRFLIHRSWLFHSVLLPTALIFTSLWLLKSINILSHSGRWLRWLRDAAIGLSVGMSAHLLWDALLSYTKSGFRIYGWDDHASFTWLTLNLILGFGIPFLVVWVMNSPGSEINI